VYSRALAEDLVAEVFAELWSNRRFEQINTSYRAYLYKAVRHRAFNALKKELSRSVSTEEANTQLASPMQTPDQVMQYNELQQKIEVIIQNLPPQCRRAFLLHRLEAKRYEDISRELSITPSAVERLISRALAKLRQELKAGGFISLLLMLFFH
jgi:RNA polymerase sigma-70 factor (ECF subfamily)